jgi:hypothetical protein
LLTLIVDLDPATERIGRNWKILVFYLIIEAEKGKGIKLTSLSIEETHAVALRLLSLDADIEIGGGNPWNVRCSELKEG